MAARNSSQGGDERCCGGSCVDGQNLFPSAHKTGGGRRRLVAMLFPALVVHFCWWSYMVTCRLRRTALSQHPVDSQTATATDFFAAGSLGQIPRGHLFELFGQQGGTVPGYWMSITMVVGSLMAGATSR